jgi:hypothetical protein
MASKTLNKKPVPTPGKKLSFNQARAAANKQFGKTLAKLAN